MHVNHRRKKGKSRRFKPDRRLPPWNRWKRAFARYDVVSIGGSNLAFYVLVFRAPETRFRFVVRSLIRDGRYDDVPDRVPGHWDFDD